MVPGPKAGGSEKIDRLDERAQRFRQLVGRKVAQGLGGGAPALLGPFAHAAVGVDLRRDPEDLFEDAWRGLDAEAVADNLAAREAKSPERSHHALGEIRVRRQASNVL